MTCIKGKGLIYTVNLDKIYHFLKPQIYSSENKRFLLIKFKNVNAYMTLEKIQFLYYVKLL